MNEICPRMLKKKEEQNSAVRVWPFGHYWVISWKA